MRRAVVVAQFVIPGCLACHAPEEPSRATVRLAVNKAAVSAGDSITVTITVVNRSTKDAVTLDPRSYACTPPYTVRDWRGRHVELPARYCLAIAYAPRTLSPGDSLVLRDRWRTNRNDRSLGAVPVDPDVYLIAARVPVDERLLSSDPVALEIARASTR